MRKSGRWPPVLLGMLRLEVHLHRLPRQNRKLECFQHSQLLYPKNRGISPLEFSKRRVRSRLHADVALVLGMPDRTTRTVLELSVSGFLAPKKSWEPRLLPLRTASTVHRGILLLKKATYELLSSLSSGCPLSTEAFTKYATKCKWTTFHEQETTCNIK